MKSTAIFPIVALLFLAACSPSDNSPQAASSTNRNMTNDGAFGQYVGGLAQAKQNAGKTVDVASLNREIQMFQVDKGRYPRDLDELVQEKYLEKIPPAPYGMRINYDPNSGVVTVVNQ